MSPMSLPDLFGGFVHLHVHSQYSFLDAPVAVPSW